ncbi:uncharacterized protein TNCV_4634081 [Trichonephila clavipes]|nr:uncharacterized protein TNCV_4634081 [Trichonephila clavipes]
MDNIREGNKAQQKLARESENTPTGSVEENLIGLLAVTEATGEYLTNAILGRHGKNGLDIQNCRGQGYDNGANMVGPKEELLGLLPLKDQTLGEDIANAVIECMDKHHIPLDKNVSISTDGAKSMTCVRKGFEIQLLDLKNKEIWRSKFERLCVELEMLEKKKSDLSSQHKWSALNDLEKEDMIIFNA